MSLDALKEQIYNYVVEYKIYNDGLSPSYPHIRQALNLPRSVSVYYHMRLLEQDGRLILTDTGIRILGGVWLPPIGIDEENLARLLDKTSSKESRIAA